MKTKERLNKEIILRAIYKHKALSVKQLTLLLGLKSHWTINSLITRYLKEKYLTQIKTPVGVFYFLTSKGAKHIGLARVNRVARIEKEHTDVELKTIRHLVKTKVIKPKTYMGLLDSYKTDRELKRIKFEELGGSAMKLRWVDLLVSTKDGDVAFEIEITRKGKDRYPTIIAKLDKQFKKDKWTEINWVVWNKDVKWFIDTIGKAKPLATHNIQIIEELNNE